jgi:hypothetical protein
MGAVDVRCENYRASEDQQRNRAGTTATYLTDVPASMNMKAEMVDVLSHPPEV